jgi:hypothetical protein
VPGEGDWSGTLKTGEVAFRVVAPEPKTKPEVGLATGPGRYILAPGVRLQVTRISHPDGTFGNEAEIQWIPSDPPMAAPTQKAALKLPEGLKTFAIVWERGGSVLWIAESKKRRRVDFSKANAIEERIRFSKAMTEEQLADAVAKKLQEAGPLADPPTSEPPVAPPVAPKGPMVLGVDLSSAKKTTRMEDLTDLFEPDPSHPGMWRGRQGVFEAPLDEHAWLQYPVAAQRYFVQYRDDRAKPETERYYGPFSGDPFGAFKLEETLTGKLQGEHSGADAMYRIALMLRTKDVGLARRAVRLMEAALEPKVEPYQHESYIASLNNLLADNAEILKHAELAAGVNTVKRKLAEFEAEIERLTSGMPDSAYTRPSVGKSDPGSRPGDWGEPQKGLRAAAIPASRTVHLGEQTEVHLLVENVGNATIKFSVTDLIQSAHAKVRNAKGEPVAANLTWYSGWKMPSHYLKPGEKIELAKPWLLFALDAGHHEHGQSTAVGPPGVYRVKYTFSLGLGSHWMRGRDGVMVRTSPAKGEWTGTLSSGEFEMDVRQ